MQLQETQAELETSLLVTKSNLTLALSNTEMLEEALKRADSMKGKDIGWRRWSDREGLLKRSQVAAFSLPLDASTPTTRISEDGSEVSTSHTQQGKCERANSEADRPVPRRSQSEIPSPIPPSSLPLTSTVTAPPSRTPTPTPPPAGDGGFFARLRFGKASASSSNILESSAPSVATSKTAAASLPALAASLEGVFAAPGSTADTRDTLLAAEKKRTAELEHQLENERKAKAEVIAEKTGIETELETLSTALFEEANKMVAAERIKRAEVEEELKIARDEKEALRSALRIIESENKAARSTASELLPDPRGVPSKSPVSSSSQTSTPTRGAAKVSTDSLDSRLSTAAVSVYPTDASPTREVRALLEQDKDAVAGVLPAKAPSHTGDSKETSPVPPSPLQLTSSPPTISATLPSADPEINLDGDKLKTTTATKPAENETASQNKTLFLTPSPSSPVTPSRSKLSVPPSPSLSSPSRYSPSNSSPSPIFQRDPSSGVIASPLSLSSRVAAARQAFETSASDRTVRKVKPRKGSPPPPMKIPGHVPRLPTPKPARSAGTPSAKEGEKT